MTQSREWHSLTPEMQTKIEQYQNNGAIPLGALAKDLGLVVKSSTLKAGISGEIMPDDSAPSGFLIRVNKHENRPRQRFTLAHEIAHFLIHQDQIGDGIEDDVLYRSTLSNSREAEANRLAADIVMPWDLIEVELQNITNYTDDEKAEKLSKFLQVSETALKIRLGLT
jgi:Zn-dependent peptidase ImmA (M78 family)